MAVAAFIGDKRGPRSGFMGKQWDGTGIAYSVDLWLECLRVLKPGGHLLSFGATRTWHRMACAVEDAGFEIRDTITWHYSSGFLKSLDVSKAIDKAAGAEREVVGQADRKASLGSTGVLGASRFGEVPVITAPATTAARQWFGWGTALKPASEPIIVARKPLEGTGAANVLAHGTGALNIDATRVPGALGGDPNRFAKTDGGSFASFSEAPVVRSEGRWPANVVFAHTPDCGPDDSTACVEGCPVAELDAQSGIGRTNRPSSRGAGGQHGTLSPIGAQDSLPYYDDLGGASRFFPTFRYQAKAPSKERPTYVRPMLRLRSELTPEQVDHVTARLREAGVEVA